MRSADEILAEALTLSIGERGDLAARLIESLEEDEAPDTPQEIEEAWAVEIQRRREDLASGKVKAIPWEEACRKIFEPPENPELAD